MVEPISLHVVVEEYIAAKSEQGRVIVVMLKQSYRVETKLLNYVFIDYAVAVE